MSEYPFFFTWTSQAHAQPLEIRGGRGAWFETTDGEHWLDLGSLVFQVNAGHGHRRIIDAICAQARRLCVSTANAVYPEKLALAESLLALAPPGFTKVFFTLGGSDANENAFKIARAVTGRHKVLSRYRSYHGATMGAVSLTGDWRRPPVEPGVAGVVHVLDWECAACPYGVRSPTCDHEPITNIPQILDLEGPRSCAAVFLESVGGANGVLIPPPGYFRRVRDACDRHGALLVADEVLTGFGRTGRWFAFEHFDDVSPDIITLGKALTSGYGTLGAVLVHERVAKHFDTNILTSGLTHYAHPLGVAAALEAIRVYHDEGLITRAAALESRLRSGLEALQARWPEDVRQSRVIGLLSATELVLDEKGWAHLSAALKGRKVHAHVIPRSGAIILSPPLCITEDELDVGLHQISAALEEVFT